MATLPPTISYSINETFNNQAGMTCSCNKELKKVPHQRAMGAFGSLEAHPN